MGQTVGNMGNANVVDPRQAKWGDLDGSEKTARVLGGGLKGFGNAMQNQPQMAQGGGMAPIQPVQAQQVDPSFFQPKRNSNSGFFGG